MFLIYLLSLLFTGTTLIKLLSFKKLSAKDAVIFLPLGFGAISLILFWSSLFTGNFLAGYIVIFITTILGSYFLVRSIAKTKVIRPLQKKGTVYIVLLILILLPFFLQPFLKVPFVVWDSWSLWGLKAKVFFFEKSIPFNLLQNREILSFDRHPYYPLNLALNQSFLAALSGNFDEARMKLISLFFGVSCALLIYFFLKKHISSFLSFLVTFVFIFTPVFILHAAGFYSGLSDIIFLFYNTALFIALIDFYISKQKKYFYLSCMLASLSLWTKIEGFIVLAAALAVILTFYKGRERFKLALKYISFSFLINIAWVIALFIPNIGKSGHVFVLSQLFSRLFLVAKSFGGQFLAIEKWGFIWIALLCILLLRTFKGQKNIYFNFFLTAFFVELIGYFFILTFHAELFKFISVYFIFPLERFLLQALGLAIIILGVSKGERDEIISCNTGL